MARNVMQWGAAFLAKRMGTAAGVCVVYARHKLTPSERRTTLTGWWGQDQEEVNPANGQTARVDQTVRDFLFLATDLKFGEPEEGDCLQVGGEIYEVKPTAGTPAWRWSDNTRTIRRVRVKLFTV